MSTKKLVFLAAIGYVGWRLYKASMSQTTGNPANVASPPLANNPVP